MKLDFLYYIGLVLALLAELMNSIVPVHTPEMADVFFLLYMMSVAKMKFNRAYVLWMLSVFAFFAISMAWSINTWNCYWAMRQFFVMAIGILATYNYLKSSPGNIKKLLKVYLVVSLFLIVFVLMHIDQIESGTRLGQQVDESLGEEGALNSNLIAINLCYALYAGFVLFFQGKKSKLVKVAVLGASAFVVYLILLTGSRKAIILLLLPFIIQPLLNKNIGKKLLLIPIAAGVAALGFYLIMYVPILYEAIGVRFEDAINVVTGSTVGGEDISRAMLIEYGIEWFKERPALGYGINCFRVLSDKTWMFGGKNFYAHNNYLELLVDVGVIGTLIYYSCYFYLWKKLKGHFADNPLNKWVAILIVVQLFLDFAMVSYYSFNSNLILCLCFFAAEKTQNIKVKNTVIKHEASRHYQTV